MLHQRAGSVTLAVAAGFVLGVLALGACDSRRASGAAPSVEPARELHPESDDEEHQPSQPRVATPSEVALSPKTRPLLTTLRVSAHVGSVILRKSGENWEMAGATGCVVEPARIERALDNLSALTAQKTDERPSSGQEFELQIVALMDQEPALHFDIAGRHGGSDLVQLRDETTVRLVGLDRQLWSPQPHDWCKPRP